MQIVPRSRGLGHEKMLLNFFQLVLWTAKLFSKFEAHQQLLTKTQLLQTEFVYQ